MLSFETGVEHQEEFLVVHELALQDQQQDQQGHSAKASLSNIHLPSKDADVAQT